MGCSVISCSIKADGPSRKWLARKSRVDGGHIINHLKVDMRQPVDISKPVCVMIPKRHQGRPLGSRTTDASLLG